MLGYLNTAWGSGYLVCLCKHKTGHSKVVFSHISNVWPPHIPFTGVGVASVFWALYRSLGVTFFSIISLSVKVIVKYIWDDACAKPHEKPCPQSAGHSLAGLSTNGIDMGTWSCLLGPLQAKTLWSKNIRNIFFTSGLNKDLLSLGCQTPATFIRRNI